MNKDSYLIYQTYLNENMPYPEFAKLAKHASSKLPENRKIEKPSYTHEKIAAELPKDIEQGKEGENKILNLAASILAKLMFNGDQEKASKMMYYDEDFNSDLVSTYRHYQKNGFPEVKEKDESEFREQMPDSREEYSAHDYAKETEEKGEGQKIGLEDEEKKSKWEDENERNWVDSFYKTFGPGYREELEKGEIDPYEFYVDYYGRLYEDDVIRKYTSIYNKKNSDHPVDADKLLMVMHAKRQEPLKGYKHPGK